jgi:hypothetical protein
MMPTWRCSLHQQTTNLLWHSIPHTGNVGLILVMDPFISPRPTCNQQSNRDLTVNAADEVEHMVSGAVLVVVEDAKHVSRLKVYHIYCTREKGNTTGLTGAYVADARDEEGLSIVAI